MKIIRPVAVGALAFVLATSVDDALANAESYPTKPVRLIVGFAPGGAADILARIVAVRLSETSGKSFIIDNRPGAGSTLGAEIAAKAAPDGHTLLFVSSSHAASAGLYQKLPYDSVRSFSAISLVATAPQVMLANPSVSAKSLKEVLELAKASPGKLNYGSAGEGSTTHLAGELLSSMTGVKLTHVPYKGGALALTDTITGNIQFMFFSMPPALPHIRSGRVRAIAVTSTKRFPDLPEVQTFAETLPGYEAINWYALLAPAGVPKPILANIYSRLTWVLNEPAVAKAIVGAGAELQITKPEETTAYIQSEIAKWTKVIKEAKLVAR
jgi:tripartite-type tricarboxylate transporter receptor subunit TctC